MIVAFVVQSFNLIGDQYFEAFKFRVQGFGRSTYAFFASPACDLYSTAHREVTTVIQTSLYGCYAFTAGA